MSEFRTVGEFPSIWIGWDAREREACIVTLRSLLRHLSACIPLHTLTMEHIPNYYRPTRRVGHKLFDVNSTTQEYDGAMSTSHACARFWVPQLARRGWALFMDGDMLVRRDISPVFDGLSPHKALYCVKHNYEPTTEVKKGGDDQIKYFRKNWSSFMLFNTDHPAHRSLTVDVLNTLPGRYLHAFFWLTDDEIGELDPKWNWLAGVSDPSIDPAVVHYTEGVPSIPGYENSPYADEWRSYLNGGSM